MGTPFGSGKSDEDWDTIPRAQGGPFYALRALLVVPILRCDRCFVAWARTDAVAARLDELRGRVIAEVERRRLLKEASDEA